MSYYNQIASGYEELHKEEQLKKLNLIAKHFQPKQSDALLDVGCGTGISTRFWDCRRAGIDTAEELIKIAKEKDREGIYLAASAEKIPFESKSFDIVTSITSIHNFNNLEKGLSEIKRVAKDKVILSILKKAKDADETKAAVRQLFCVEKELEEEKDIIFIGKI